MTPNGWLQIGAFLLAILAVTPLLGRYMTRVFNRERTWLDPVLRPIERLIYRSTGVDETRTAGAAQYLSARLQRARMEAVLRSAAVAVQFTHDASGYSYAFYVDGNGNGVVARDIQRGVDRRINAVEPAFPC